MSNSHPTSKMNRIHAEEMAESPLSVRLRVEIDSYVRSRPNRTEWLRKAIERQVQEDLKEAG